MAHVALCPQCRGIIAVDAVVDGARKMRCPRCAAIFSASELADSFVLDPPLAVPVEEEVRVGEPVAAAAAAPVSEMALAPTVEVSSPASPASFDLPGDAWYGSLSAAEGAAFATGDFDDPASARPYHEDPQYNRHLAVEQHNGTAWPELAAALAAERTAGGMAVETPPPDVDDESPSPPADTAVEELPISDRLSWNNDWQPPTQSPQGAVAFGEADESTASHGYEVSGATAEAASPTAAATFTAPKRRRSQPSSSAVMIQFGGMALGGLLGLAIGYVVLLWAGALMNGSNKDFLKIGTKLPAFMVPAVVRGGVSNSTAAPTINESGERRKSFADMAKDAYQSSAEKDAQSDTSPSPAP